MTSIPARRPLAGALAVTAATAAVLATTGFTLPAATGTARDDAAKPSATASTAAQRTALEDATLDWGFKKSFRGYVQGIAFGEITTSDGASERPDGTFRFGPGEGTYAAQDHAVTATFDGEVRFRSKLHGFDITLGGLRLVTGPGTSGRISADVTTDGSTDRNVELATLDLTDTTPRAAADGTLAFPEIPARLTADGAAAFDGMYDKDEELDPVTLALTPGTAPTDEPATAPGSAKPSTPAPTTKTPVTETPAADRPTAKRAARPESGRIVDGTLDWGVKKSFRDYVTGPIGNGRADVSGGAKKQGNAGYRFPGGSGTFDAKSPSLDAGFDGGVRFRAHQQGGAYALDLSFSRIRVRAGGDGGTLVADVSSKDRESGKVTRHDGLPVAKLKLPKGGLTPKNGVVTLDRAPAALTAKGAEAFGGFYRPGDALDPVTAAVSLDKDAKLPSGPAGDASGASGGASGGASSGGPAAGPAGGTGTDGGDTAIGGVAGGGSGDGAVAGGGGSLAATGAGVSSPLLLGGSAALVAAGAAAVCAVRRRASEG
ncbi:HtaA domain-containing protein [Streptomyces sp. HNM0574]|uniref:HtaA domain-containing protein n=1 Tax=Streptomyces sp. HNM0574 TaxID=2714954 RepID=UPI00146A5D63|nr:HtaA domain-containing protein [Streptomyces sp. HNM0574]NLU70028.1 hypothetical protein [Streptomyces sp. HNM0574]